MGYTIQECWQTFVLHRWVGGREKSGTGNQFIHRPRHWLAIPHKHVSTGGKPHIFACRYQAPPTPGTVGIQQPCQGATAMPEVDNVGSTRTTRKCGAPGQWHPVKGVGAPDADEDVLEHERLLLVVAHLQKGEGAEMGQIIMDVGYVNNQKRFYDPSTVGHKTIMDEGRQVFCPLK